MGLPGLSKPPSPTLLPTNQINGVPSTSGTPATEIIALPDVVAVNTAVKTLPLNIAGPITPKGVERTGVELVVR